MPYGNMPRIVNELNTSSIATGLSGRSIPGEHTRSCTCQLLNYYAMMDCYQSLRTGNKWMSHSISPSGYPQSSLVLTSNLTGDWQRSSGNYALLKHMRLSMGFATISKSVH